MKLRQSRRQCLLRYQTRTTIIPRTTTTTADSRRILRPICRIRSEILLRKPSFPSNHLLSYLLPHMPSRSHHLIVLKLLRVRPPPSRMSGQRLCLPTKHRTIRTISTGNIKTLSPMPLHKPFTRKRYERRCLRMKMRKEQQQESRALRQLNRTRIGFKDPPEIRQQADGRQ